jgi:hypothetical protein
MKVQRWRMWMQQYNYEVRLLSGVLNAEADSMSRIFEHLHLSNLFATAPTSEQADHERRTGVIAPSTRLCGHSEADSFVAASRVSASTMRTTRSLWYKLFATRSLGVKYFGGAGVPRSHPVW